MSEEQLGLPGIGQQKMTLGQWKKENGIYTHHSPHMEDHPWSAWCNESDHGDFLGKYGDEAMGLGNNERQAIEDLIEKWKGEIEPPFWW